MSLFTRASNGDVDGVKRALDEGADDYNQAMMHAALRGHMDIILLMIERGADNYYGAMVHASAGGHWEIVNYLTKLRDACEAMDGLTLTK